MCLAAGVTYGGSEDVTVTDIAPYSTCLYRTCQILLARFHGDSRYTNENWRYSKQVTPELDNPDMAVDNEGMTPLIPLTWHLWIARSKWTLRRYITYIHILIWIRQLGPYKSDKKTDRQTDVNIIPWRLTVVVSSFWSVDSEEPLPLGKPYALMDRYGNRESLQAGHNIRSSCVLCTVLAFFRCRQGPDVWYPNTVASLKENKKPSCR